MTSIEEFQKTLAELHITEAQFRMCAANEMMKEAIAKRIQAEEALEAQRFDRERNKHKHRPSRENWIELTFDSEKNQWVASHQSVIAYGDTPEMACDNFDHLWMFGDNNVKE